MKLGPAVATHLASASVQAHVNTLCRSTDSVLSELPKCRLNPSVVAMVLYTGQLGTQPLLALINPFYKCRTTR